MRKKPANHATNALNMAYRRTMVSRYYWSLQVLWPNIAPIMWRVSEYVGYEIRPTSDQPLLIDTIIVEVKTQLSEIETSGSLLSNNLDRDVMVHFLRLLLRETARVHCLKVQCGDNVWDATQIGFNLWRQTFPGPIKVDQRSEFDPKATSKTMLYQIATHLMSPLDWEILGEDHQRLWSLDGAPLSLEQTEDDAKDTDRPLLYQ